MITCDERNERARRLRDGLMEHLSPGDEGSVHVVIGGDGFLLRTVHESGNDDTYLGLNAGHMGFLLNDVEDHAEVARGLRAGDWRTYSFPLLNARITKTDGTVVQDAAINDVYLERSSGQTARLSIAIEDQIVVDALVADGVIFATALGSTAYNFSAGGMACHPELPILTVTPICPHHPRLHPFALPPSVGARVTVQRGEHRPVRAVVDGRDIPDVAHVDIGYTGASVNIAYLAGHNFTSRMVRKILRP